MTPSLPRHTLAAAVVVGLAGAAQATTLSLNFTDNLSAESTMLAADVAGAPGVEAANWNNLQVSGGSGSGSSLVYDDGSAAGGAAVSWSTDLAQWRLGHTPADGHDRMWKGYLDAASASTVTVSGLSFIGTYDVHIYFDGSNGGDWRVANFAIGGVSDGGEDSENTNWGSGQNTAKLYQIPVPGSGGNQPYPTSPNNDEGNYIVLSGITGSSFTLDAAGGSSGSGTRRAPINGIQIVGTIPEPSIGLLALLGGLLMFSRRRS